MKFQLHSKFNPTGDQPKAIKTLTSSVNSANPHQTLLGVTGSGKTFTVANIIQNTQLPTLVISHNKTLAAQLYQELRDFFPKNAVSYFVSYYDYYQPEAYLPQTDTYIEKDASINEEIDKLRLSTTANLSSRTDCIVVASVSCIYNLGSPVAYQGNVLELTPGQLIDRRTIITRLIDLQYQRTTQEIKRGYFRSIGDSIQLHPADEEKIININLESNRIKDIEILDRYNFTPLKPQNKKPFNSHITYIYPAKHFIANPDTQKKAIKNIRQDLQIRLQELRQENKLLEAQRLEQKVNYDLASIAELGFVNGIENYSIYFDGRQPNEPPYTLLDHFKHNTKKFNLPGFLTVIDESHITLPQIKGMFAGDRSRKQTLIEYGFRLPSALDNRPLTFSEFSSKTPIKLYASATPTDYEIGLSKTSKIPTVAEQLIRPTGLLDPIIELKPSKNQITTIIKEIKKRKKVHERSLVLTLTKATAEDLTEYIENNQDVSIQEPIKVAYLHSGIKTLDRSDILDSLRIGEYDCLIGINLLREGLDIPEVSYIAIIDADKEGFLRTPTALIQIIGRAARHLNGKVTLFADKVSPSMKIAIDETSRRRKIQGLYNKKHNITPQSIQKPVRKKLIKRDLTLENKRKIKELSEFGWTTPEQIQPDSLTPQDKTKLIKRLTQLMNQAAKNWEFEQAATLRDSIQKLQE